MRTNVMKKRKALVSAVATLGCFAGFDAWGATWQGSSGGTNLWATSSNWVGGTLPGTELLYFNVAGSAITLGSGRVVTGLYFDSLAGQFDIGSGIATNTIGFNLGTSSNYSNYTQTISAPANLTGNISLLGTSGFTFTGKFTNNNGSRILTNNLSTAGGVVLTLNAVDLSQNGTSRTLTINGSGSATINGTVANGSTSTGGGIIYSGTGVLTLAGANTYAGGTTVSSGTVTLSGSGTLGSTASPLTVAGGLLNLNSINQTVGAVSITGAGTVSGGTLTASSVAASNSGIASISANLVFSGGLNKSGAGTLALSGNNTYTGNTTVGNGTLSLGSANAINNSGTIVFTGGTGILQFTSATNTTDYSGNIKNSPGQVRLDTNSLNASIGAIDSSNTSGLTKDGTGTLTLTAVNTYGNSTASNTIISAGTLKMGTTDALPYGANLGFVTATGTLDINGYNTHISALNGTGTVTSGTGGAATLTLGYNNSDTSFSGTFTDGSSTLSLTKVGTGNFTTSAATFANTGGINIYAGTLTSTSGTPFGTSSAVSIGDPQGAIHGNPSVTIALSQPTTANTSSITVNAGSTGTLTLQVTNGTSYFNGNIALNNNLTISMNNAANGKDIIVGGSITESGSQPLTLTGTCTATSTSKFLTINGPIVVSSGGLTLLDTANGYYNTNNTISGSGDLTIRSTHTGASGTMTVASTGTGLSVVNLGIKADGGSAISVSAPVNITGALTNSGTGSTITTISGAVGASVTNVTQNSTTSELDLTNSSNTFQTLTIKAGTVVGTSISSAFGTGQITLGDTSGGNGATLQLSAAANATASNNIVVQAGSTGPLTIAGKTKNATFTGTVSLNNNLILDGITSGGPLALNQITQGSTAGPLTITRGSSGAAPVNITGLISINSSGLTLATLGNASSTSTFVPSGGVSGTGPLTLRANGGTSGTITLSGNLNVGSITNTGTGSGLVTISGPMGSSVASLTQNSSTSNLKLTAANPSFTGSANVVSGSLILGLGTALTNNAVAISNGGIFDVQTAGTIAGLNDGSGGTGETVTNTTGTARILTLGGSGTYSYGGTLTASTAANLALTVSLIGSGSQTLSGANSYAGGTTVNSGALRLSGSGTLGSASAPLTMSGGTLDLGTTSQTVGALSMTGPATISSGTLAASSYSASNASGTASITSQLSGSGALSKSGAGILSLGADNSAAYAGNVAVNGGTLNFVSGALGTGNVTFGGGTLQYASGNTQNIATRLKNSGTGAAMALDVNGNTVNFGVIDSTNAGGLTLTSTATGGVLVLTGAQGYTGATTLTSGTLQLGASSSLASTGSLAISNGTFDLNGNSQTLSAVTVSGSGTISGGTLSVNGATIAVSNATGTAYISANLSGTANLQKSGVGAGTLVLSGSNTYTGSTTINAGTTVQLGSNNAIPSGVGSGNTALAGILDLNGNSPTVGGLSSGATTGVVTTTLTGAATLIVGSNGLDTTYKGAIANGSGTLALTKSGTGTLSIANAQTFSGGVNILNGAVYGQNSAAFGTGPIILGDSSGTNSAAILADNGTGTYANPITVQGGSSGTLMIQQTGSNNPDFSGGVLLKNNLAVDAVSTKTLKFSTAAVTQGASSLTISKGTGAGSVQFNSGILLDSSGLTLADNGPGSITITGLSGSGGVTNAGTGSGVVTINASLIASTVTSITQNSGTNGSPLALGVSGNVGWNGPVDVVSGTLQLTQGGVLTANNLVTIYNGGTLDVTTSQTLALADGSAGTGEIVTTSAVAGKTLTLGGAGNDVFAGKITGTNLSLAVAAGTHTLSGTANDYGGQTNVNNGTLMYGADNAIPSTSNVTLNANSSNAVATLDLNGKSGTIASLTMTSGSTPATGAGTGATRVFTGAGTLTLGGNVTFTNNGGNVPSTPVISGKLDLGGATRTFTVGDSTAATVDLNVTASIAGTGAGLTKTGQGTLRLAGNNTYTGPTTIDAGTLQADSATALGNGGNITFTGGTLQFTSNSAGTYSGARIQNSTSAMKLDLNGQTVTLTGSVDTTNTAGLTISGNGTLELTGTNTYGGTTTIAGGNLLISGSGSVTSAIAFTGTGGTLKYNSSAPLTQALTITSGNTLGGSGVLGDVVIASGATLSPGNSPGQLSYTTLSLAGTTHMEIAGTGAAGIAYDNNTITTSGGLTYGGLLEVVPYGGYDLSQPGTYDLFTISGAYAGDLSDVTVGLGLDLMHLTNSSGVWTGADSTSTYTFTQSTGELTVVLIPEPSTIALVGGIISVSLIGRRRRAAIKPVRKM